MVVGFITFVVQLWLKLELSVTSINWFSITFEAFQCFSIWNEKSCLFGPLFFFSKKKKLSWEEQRRHEHVQRWRWPLTNWRSQPRQKKPSSRSLSYHRLLPEPGPRSLADEVHRGRERIPPPLESAPRRAPPCQRRSETENPGGGILRKNNRKVHRHRHRRRFFRGPEKSRRRNFRCSHFFLLLRGRKMIFARHRRRTARREAKSRWRIFRRCRLDKKNDGTHGRVLDWSGQVEVEQLDEEEGRKNESKEKERKMSNKHLEKFVRRQLRWSKHESRRFFQPMTSVSFN